MATPAVVSSSPPTTPVAMPRRRLQLPRMQELGLLIVILVMGTGLSIYGAADAAPGRENTFLNLPNLVDQIATNMSYYAIMAVGMTLVIVTGGIDISVGSTMAASALAGAWVLQHFPREAPAPEVLALGIGVPLAVGFACGLLNGSLVVAGLHPFIVTLGTMSIIRGLAIVAPPMKTLPTAGHRLPEAFTTHFAQLKLREFDSMRKIAGWIDRCIPVERLQQFLHGVGELRMMPMIIMLVVTAIGWFYLSQTIGGREIYAVGGNEEAARFSGVRTNRVKLRVYVLAGITAGIAGMVSLGRFGSASSNTANGYELTVVAAAVVGGASLSGGRGSAIGALLGALLIAMIENGIDTLHWNSEYRKVIIGAAIIIAVAIDQLSSYLRARRLRGSRT